MGCVYIATNRNNGKVYIGKTVQSLEVRKRSHFRGARTQEKLYLFQKAIRKHGEDAFDWKTLFESGDNQELLLWEQYFIEEYDSGDPRNGYNLSLGGEGLIPNVATREKLKLSAKEVGNRPEVRRARSNTRKRIMDTEDGRRCHAEAVRAACRTPEWQEKHKRVLSDLHANKEIKERLSHLNKERAKDPVWIEKNKKNLERAHEASVIPVVCLDTGIIYHGSMDAHRKLGMQADKVTGNCRERIKSTMGYHFRYATKDEVVKYRLLRKTLGNNAEISLNMIDN